MLVRHALKYVAIIIVFAGVALSHRVVDAETDAVEPTPERRPALHGHVKRHVRSGQHPLTHRRHRRKREVSHSSGDQIPGLDHVEPVLPEPHHFELSTDVAKKHHKKLKKVSTKAQIRDRINEVNTMLFGEQSEPRCLSEEAEEPAELLSRSTSKEHAKSGCKNSKTTTGGIGTNSKCNSPNHHAPKASCSSTTECEEIEPTESCAKDTNSRHGTASKSENNASSDKLFGIYDEQSMQFVPLQMGKLSSKRDDSSPLDSSVQETAYQIEQVKKLYGGHDLDCSADKESHEDCHKEASHKDVVHLARVQSDPHSRQLHPSHDKQNDAVVDLRPTSKQISVDDSSRGEMCHLARIEPAHKHDQHKSGQNQKHSSSTGHRSVISNVPIVILGPKVIRGRAASNTEQSGSLMLKRSSDGYDVVERETASISPAEQCDLLKAVQNVAQKAVLVLSNPVLLSGATSTGSAEEYSPSAAQSEAQAAVLPRSQCDAGNSGGNRAGMAENDGMTQNVLTELKLGCQAESAVNKPGMGQNDLAFSGTSHVNSAVGNSALNKPGMSQNDLCTQNTQQNNKAAMAQIDSAFAGPSQVNSAMSNLALNKPGMAQNDLAFGAPSHINSAFANSALNKPGMSQNELCAQPAQQLNQAGMAQNDLALSGSSQLNSALGNSQINRPGMSQADICHPNPGNKAGMAQKDFAMSGAAANLAINKQGMAQNDLAMLGPSQINSAASSSAVNKAGMVQNDLCVPSAQSPNKAGMAQNELEFSAHSQANGALVNSALNKPGMSQDDICKPANKAGMAQNDLAMTGSNQLNSATSNLGFYKPGMSMNDIFNPKVNKGGSGLNDLASSAHLNNAAANSALNKPGMSENDLCTQAPQQNSKAAMAQIDSSLAGTSQINSAAAASALNKPGMSQNDLCTQKPQQNSKAAMAQIESTFAGPSKVNSAVGNSALNKPGMAQNDLCTQTPQQNSKAAMAQIDSAFAGPSKVNSAVGNSALNKPGMAQNDLCTQTPQQNSKAAMAQIDSAFAGPSKVNSAVGNSALNKPGIAQNDLCTQSPAQSIKAAMAQIDSAFGSASPANSAMSNAALNKPGMAQNELCTQKPQQNNKAAMAQIDSAFGRPSQVNSAVGNSALNKPGMAQNDLCTQSPQQNNKAAMAQIDSAFAGPSQVNSAAAGSALNKPGMAQNDLCNQNPMENNKAGMAQKDLAANQTALNKAGTAQSDICLRNPPPSNKAGMADKDLAVGAATNQVNNSVCNATVNKPGMSKDDLQRPQQTNKAGEAQNDLPASTPGNRTTTADCDVAIEINKEFQAFNESSANRAGVNTDEVTHRLTTEDASSPGPPTTVTPVNKAGFGDKDITLPNQKTSATTTSDAAEDVKYEWPTGECNKETTPSMPSESKSTKNPVKNAQAGNAADVGVFSKTKSSAGVNKQTPKLAANATKANATKPNASKPNANKGNSTKATASAFSHCENSFQALFNATGAAVDEKQIYPEVTNKSIASTKDIAAIDKDSASRPLHTTACPSTGGYVFPEQAGTLVLPCEDRTTSTPPPPPTETTARPVRSGDRRLVLVKRHLSADQMRRHLAAVSFMKGFNGNALFPPGWVPTGAEPAMVAQPAGSPTAGNPSAGPEPALGAETYYTGDNAVRPPQDNVLPEASLAASSRATAQDKGLAGYNGAENAQEVSRDKVLAENNEGVNQQREPGPANNVAINQQGDANAKALPIHAAADANSADSFNSGSYSLDRFGLDDDMYVKPLPDLKPANANAFPGALNTESVASSDLRVETQAEADGGRFAANVDSARPPVSSLVGNVKSTLQGRLRPNELGNAPLLSPPRNLANPAQMAPSKQGPLPVVNTAQADASRLVFSDTNGAPFHQLQANFDAVPSSDVASSPEKSSTGEVSQLKMSGPVPELNAYGFKEMEKPAEPSSLDVADPFQMPIVRVDEEAGANQNAASKYSSSLQDIYLPSVNSKTSLDNVLGQPRPQEQEIIQHLISTAYGDRRYLHDGVPGERHARNVPNDAVDDLNEFEPPNGGVDDDDEMSDYERLRRDIDDVIDEVDDYKRLRRDMTEVEDYDRLNNGVVDEFEDYDAEDRDPRRVLEFLRHQAMTYAPHKRQWQHMRDPYWERMYENLAPSREDSYLESEEEVERRPPPRPKARCHEESHTEVDERPTPPPPRMYVPPVDSSNHNFELPERVVKVRKRSIESKQHPFGERGQGDSSASEGLDRSQQDNRVEGEECSTTAPVVEEDDVQPDEEEGEETTEKKEVNLVPDDVEEDMDDEFETDLELASPDHDEDADASDEAEERQEEGLEEGGRNNTDKTARRARRVQTDPARPSADKVVVMVSLPVERDYDSVWQRTAPPPPPLRVVATSTVDPFDVCFESFGKTTDLAEPLNTHKVDVNGKNSTQDASSLRSNTTTQCGHNVSISSEASTSMHTTSETRVTSPATNHSSEVMTNATRASSSCQTSAPTSTISEFDFDVTDDSTHASKESPHSTPSSTNVSCTNSTSSIANSTHPHSTTSSIAPKHGDQPKTDFNHSTTEMSGTSTCHASTLVKSNNSKLVADNDTSIHHPNVTEVSNTHNTSCSLQHSTHTTHSSKRTSNHPHTTPKTCSSARRPPLTHASKNASCTVIKSSKSSYMKSSRLQLDKASEDTTHTCTSPRTDHLSTESCKNSSHQETSQETSKSSVALETPSTPPHTTVSTHSSHQSSQSQSTETKQPTTTTTTSPTSSPICLDDSELASDFSDDIALDPINDQQSINATTCLPHTTSQTKPNATVESRLPETTTDNDSMDLLAELEKLCHAAREQEARKHDKHVQRGDEKSHEPHHNTEKRRKCTGTKHSSAVKKSDKSPKTDGTKRTSVLMDSLRKHFRPVSHAKDARKEVPKSRGEDNGGSLELDTLGDWNEDDEEVKIPQESLLGTLRSQLGLLTKKEATQRRSEAVGTREVAYDDDDDLEAPAKDVDDQPKSLWSPQPLKKANHKRRGGDDMLLWCEG